MEEARGTVWLSLSTVLAAFAASLCCILPLVVAVLGAGSAALGARLAPWRPVFLAATVVLLGFAFYREYRSSASCAGSGEGCRPASSRRRLMLWVVTAFILILVTFPYYTAPIAAGQASGQKTSDGQVAKVVFRVEGMSCSGCEATLEMALQKVEGIESVEVSYDESRAEITYRPSRVGVQKIQQAIEQQGYKAERIEQSAAKRTPVSATPVALLASNPSPASGKSDLRDLESMTDLADLFRQTRGQPRLVLLLSPT